jgi:hypothetical protein
MTTRDERERLESLKTEARMVVGELEAYIKTSFKAKSQTKAAHGISTVYLNAALRINDKNMENAKNDDTLYKQYLERAVMNLCQQLYAFKQLEGASLKDGGLNFEKMANIEKLVVRIQAAFRARLARRKLATDATAQLLRAEQRRRQKLQCQEELALREMKLRLFQKCGLTPEAFFRACDLKYTKEIPASLFKLELEKRGLNLSRGQLARIELILDEDMNGTITLEEF